MKIYREMMCIFITFLLVPLVSGGALAGTNDPNALAGACQLAESTLTNYYNVTGVIQLGGGFFIDAPNHASRGYLEKYTPFPVGLLADVNIGLTSKDGLSYYKFGMSNPGFADQDFYFQAGKLGVYNVALEYDQLQNIYCTANPNINEIGILVQRLRFNADYQPTPDTDIFVEDQWLKRTGSQPTTGNGGPSSAYGFTAEALEPIDYTQNDGTVGAELDRKLYQFRMAYSISTFHDDALFNDNGLATGFVSLPPTNVAQYITGEGGWNLPAYRTRLTSSFSYGWLSDNAPVFNDAGAEVFSGANLSAATVSGYVSGVTQVCEPLTLRYSYRAYDFDNENPNNPILLAAFGTTPTDRALLAAEQYSWLQQTVTGSAQYKLNEMAAMDFAYTYQSTDRTMDQGDTSTNSPQVGIRLFPCGWLNLIANYAYSDREGSDFLTPLTSGLPLTYKFYAGDDKRNTVNFIAELFPVNNVTFSFNFSFYNDDFQNSGYGLLSDHGWSPGADVSWTPCDRVSLSLGYDHQEDSTKELATLYSGTNPPGEILQGLVTGDAGPVLLTSDSYDTITLSALIKLIPERLNWKTSASYSYSSSDFHTQSMPNLNESFANLNSFLTYKINEHWGCKVGYIFEIFQMTKAYQQLYLTGVTSTGASTNQSLNTLDGFYQNATAHVVEGFLQYRF